MDKKMMEIVGKYKVPYVMMHMKGNPQNMMNKINYDKMLKEIMQYFSKKINQAISHKINDIIIDPREAYKRQFSWFDFYYIFFEKKF